MTLLHRLRAGLGRVRLTRLAGVLVVLLAMTAVPAADAAFSDSSSLQTTTISTNTLAPPTNIAVTQTCTPPATITLRAASTATGGSTITLPTPTGTQSGDVLVAQVANRGGAFPMSVPPGWTLIRRDTSGGQITTQLYLRVATASEPASATFTPVGATSSQMAGGIAAYSGVLTSNPIDVAGGATGSGSTATTPSLTTTVTGAMLFHAVTKRQEDLPAPSGTTQRWQLMSGNGTATEGVSAGDELRGAPGVAPSRTSVSSAGFNAEWITQTVALRPIPGTPTANGTWTATPSTWATGYRVERVVGSSVQLTGYVTPVSATSASDGPLSNGVTYTYRIVAYYQSWTSTTQTATLTTNC